MLKLDLKYKKLMYGSLLHDVGKLIQRAKIYQGTHSDQGYKYLIESIGDVEIASCAKYHHFKELKDANLPNDNLAYIVYEADNIAAGIDRRISESTEDGFDPNMPLISIFNLFRYNKSDISTAYQLISLKDEKTINFPMNSKTISVSDMKYKYIFNDFNEGLKRINFEKDSIESLLKLIEWTMCYIPSSTNKNEVSDISLYNHLKTTAMISSCMFKYFEEKQISDYKKVCFDKSNRDSKMFILVSGEISGIQNFIYTISSKGALKTLRGRSFYLEMLVEHIVDEILSELELCRVNLIYLGGGHFYLLLPNTEKAKEILENAKLKINEWLIKEYSAELYFEMSFVESSANWLANDLGAKKKEKNYLGELFRTVNSKNSRNKLKRYTKSQLKYIMKPNTLKDHSRECAICGSSSKNISEFRSSLVCDSCKGMYMLGEKLPRLKSEVIIIGEIDKSDGIIMPALSDKNIKMSTGTIDEAIDMLKKGIRIRVYSINNPLTGSEYIKDIWAGNYIIDGKDGNSIEFEDLAARSKGIKRLGVLRADVDNLGVAFISGFESPDFDDKYQYISLSRNSDLSYYLSIFFKHKINKICSGSFGLNQFKLEETSTSSSKRNVVIVYSGGDDIFIVGAWNEIIELAVDINNAFRKFTNNKMSLSAGIGIFRHDFPINQMASITGKLENEAKSKGKNRIALFGVENDNIEHVYTWDNFTEGVIKDKLYKLDKWFNFDENKKSKVKLNLGRSMLYKLLELLKSIKVEKEEKINLARIAYTIARLEPEDKKLMDLYREFKTSIYKWLLNEKDLNEVLTAMNIIIYLNRKGEQ